MPGCASGTCSESGCQKCYDGYYLDNGLCVSCSSKISGCVRCRSADECLVCASDFLTIEDGICKCREGGQNQYTDPMTGSCVCNEGYFMTSRGCQTCSYLIPGCDKCAITSTNTGIELYQLADLTNFSGQKYVDCDSCTYFRYVEDGKPGKPVNCKHCSEKW